MRRVLLGMLAGGVVVALIPVVVIGPYVRDDLVLDGIVRAVALDWRDFGEDKARSRLEYELDHRGIGLHVRDDDCELRTGPEGDRHVTCEWTVQLSVPGLDAPLPLSFASEGTVTAAGDLLP